jgi:hypothetical protein
MRNWMQTYVKKTRFTREAVQNSKFTEDRMRMPNVSLRKNEFLRFSVVLDKSSRSTGFTILSSGRNPEQIPTVRVPDGRNPKQIPSCRVPASRNPK